MRRQRAAIPLQPCPCGWCNELTPGGRFRQNHQKQATALARESPNPAGRRIKELMRARGIINLAEVARHAGVQRESIRLLLARASHPISAATAKGLADWDGEWTAQQYLAAAGSAEGVRGRKMRPKRLVAFLRWYLEHANEEPTTDARRLLSELESGRRQGSIIARDFDRQEEYKDLRVAMGTWANQNGRHRRNQESRFLLSWRATYGVAARGTDAPRLSSLIAPADAPRSRGRPVEQHLPEGLRSPWGSLVVAAATRQLRDVDGLDQVTIARRFRFTVKPGRRGDYSPLVSVLWHAADRYRQRAEQGDHLIRSRWRRASAEAAQLLANVPAEISYLRKIELALGARVAQAAARNARGRR